MALKRALVLASVASMIDQFNIPNIKLLQELGYQVDVVADFTHPGTITMDRAEKLKRLLSNLGVRVFDIAIPRSINLKAIVASHSRVKKLIQKEQYKLIHCQSPIGGAICRLAAKNERKKGTKVIYTAHGFHFYAGAPIKNWIVFYPIEKWLSRYTDVLITINKEDFERAGKRFKRTDVKYIPGVGVDLAAFSSIRKTKTEKRKELDIPVDASVVLSVGELNKNKNHSMVIKALGVLRDSKVHYIIAGKGELKEDLIALAKERDVNLQLLGYRNDVSELYKAADVYALPSLREGLNVSLIEAMASGLPCVVSDIRGNRDLVDEKNGIRVPCTDIEKWASGIDQMLHQDNDQLRENSMKKAISYGSQTVISLLKDIYEESIDET